MKSSTISPGAIIPAGTAIATVTLLIGAIFAYPLGYAIYMAFHDYFFTAPGVEVLVRAGAGKSGSCLSAYGNQGLPVLEAPQVRAGGGGP